MSSHELKPQLDFLEWDSRFFGRPVFRLKPCGLMPNVMEPLIESFGDTSDGKALIYLQNAEMLPASAKMPRHWELVDVGSKVSLDLTLRPSKSLPPKNEDVSFKSWRAKETSESLRELAVTASHLSRFRIDHRMDEQLANRLYCHWIEKSVAGELADQTFIAETSQNDIVAMSTVKLVGNHATIGLFAVNERMRGKGVGHGLITYTLDWLRGVDCSTVTVSTQLNNTAAVALYQKSGFQIGETHLLNHLWVN